MDIEKYQTFQIFKGIIKDKSLKTTQKLAKFIKTTGKSRATFYRWLKKYKLGSLENQLPLFLTKIIIERKGKFIRVKCLYGHKKRKETRIFMISIDGFSVNNPPVASQSVIM